MRIGIVGSGFVGGSLGKALVNAGHEVMFSSRTPQSEKMRVLLADVGSSATAGTLQETLRYGEVIALAMPLDAIREVVKEGDWSGKILIDMNNSFGPVPERSVAEQIAEWTGARVVKALNTIGAEHYQNPVFEGKPATMFVAADDIEAKQIVSALITELGFEVINAGGLEISAQLESLARLWIQLAIRLGYGRDMAFRLVRR